MAAGGNGKANGADIGRLCDELGDLQIQARDLEKRQADLIERLKEHARITKQFHFEGKRFDASVMLGDFPHTNYRNCFELLARRTGTTDAEQAKIIKAYTKIERARRWARIYIPASNPKKRI